MKGQAKSTKYTGEERVHSDGGSLFRKLLEATKKPPIVNSEVTGIVKKTLSTESKAFGSDLFSQVTGIELKPGKSHDLSTETKNDKRENISVTSEHLTYFSEFKRSSENKKEDESTMVIKNQLNAILSELKGLKESSDELENVFKDVAIDTVPEKPGVYHLTFFEGFLKLVLKMKDKVQDGVIYAKLFKSRKQERSYHAMAKKRGTSFTMHQDRAVATQTG